MMSVATVSTTAAIKTRINAICIESSPPSDSGVTKRETMPHSRAPKKTVTDPFAVELISASRPPSYGRLC